MGMPKIVTRSYTFFYRVTLLYMQRVHLGTEMKWYDYFLLELILVLKIVYVL